MKSKALTCIVAMTLFGALAIPIRLAGQEQKGAEKELSWVRGKSLETCPELGTPAIPGRPSQLRSYPDAAFRSPNGVGIRNLD